MTRPTDTNIPNQNTHTHIQFNTNNHWLRWIQQQQQKNNLQYLQLTFDSFCRYEFFFPGGFYSMLFLKSVDPFGSCLSSLFVCVCVCLYADLFSTIFCVFTFVMQQKFFFILNDKCQLLARP